MSPTVIDGERGVSDVATPPKINRRHGAYLIGGAALVLAAVIMMPKAEKKIDEAPPPVINGGGTLEPGKAPPSTQPQQPPPPSTQAQYTTAERRTEPQKDPMDEARKAYPFGQKDQQQTVSQPATRTPVSAVQPVSAAAVQETGMAARLRPTVLSGVKASVLPHPEMLITEGTLIPCVLTTAMSSDAPGFVTCKTPYSTAGTTGTVDLLPAGTKMFGEYDHQIARGQERIFVRWDRAETPNHVIIDLASPGADALGRAGFAGQVDTHFWERFGASLLITAINGAVSMGQSALSKDGSTNLSFNGASSTADTALRESVNIPTTIRKNQGEMVSVMVARDLDFSDVYHLSLQ